MNCNRLPNMRFQPTASLAALASRRLKRGSLGGFTELDVFREKYLVVCQHSFDTTPVHRV